MYKMATSDINSNVSGQCHDAQSFPILIFIHRASHPRYYWNDYTVSYYRNSFEDREIDNSCHHNNFKHMSHITITVNMYQYIAIHSLRCAVYSGASWRPWYGVILQFITENHSPQRPLTSSTAGAHDNLTACAHFRLAERCFRWHFVNHRQTNVVSIVIYVSTGIERRSVSGTSIVITSGSNVETRRQQRCHSGKDVPSDSAARRASPWFIATQPVGLQELRWLRIRWKWTFHDKIS